MASGGLDDRHAVIGDVPAEVACGRDSILQIVGLQNLVEADRDRIALQRGPIVFAAEWPDNPGGRVRNLVIADDEPLGSEFRPDLLGGVSQVVLRPVLFFP